MLFRNLQSGMINFVSVIIFLCMFSVNIFACIDPAPETELEKIYCQIKSKGKGDTLPEYQEFRRNPPVTQALLLKRPAKKLGISLPNSRNTTSPLASKPVIQSQEKVVEKPPARPAPKKIEKPSIATQNTMAGCKLDNDIIACGTDQYELQTNLANKFLADNAFTTQNKLLLPTRQSPSFASASDHYYLSTTYVSYIEKMMDIGLADATMSFTKYVATYDDITKNGGDFAQRFAQMYELLKNERQTNAVKSRYNSNFPESLAQCMVLNRKIIVCDNVKQNWIYRSK